MSFFFLYEEVCRVIFFEVGGAKYIFSDRVFLILVSRKSTTGRSPRALDKQAQRPRQIETRPSVKSLRTGFLSLHRHI